MMVLELTETSQPRCSVLHINTEIITDLTKTVKK